jgi:hypothetical protein
MATIISKPNKWTGGGKRHERLTRKAKIMWRFYNGHHSRSMHPKNPLGWAIYWDWPQMAMANAMRKADERS